MTHSLSPSSNKRKVELVSPYINIPDNITSFTFDTYLIDECFILKNIVGHIFKKFFDLTEYKTDETALAIFVNSLCEHYNKNHFHNFQHAVNVLQMTFMLLFETEMLSKLDPNIAFATLLSAIAHDVDHPGNTNSYEINSVSKYARLYNDASVLENHHCALTFDLLEKVELMKCFDASQFRVIRKTIISCILGTDMSKHNDFLVKFGNFDVSKSAYNIDEQIFVASLFVHFADLSNPLKDFETCYEWSKRISLEFYSQTVKEELEGLPSLSFMRVHDKLSMCLNEINFLTNISIPTWKLFVDKFSVMSFITEKILSNLNKWKEMEQKELTDNDINILNY